MTVVDDLGCHVVGCAAESAPALLRHVQLGRQPKVAQFQVHVAVEEQVAQFQVTVDNVMLVQVCHGVQHLYKAMTVSKLIHSCVIFSFRT